MIINCFLLAIVPTPINNLCICHPTGLPLRIIDRDLLERGRLVWDETRLTRGSSHFKTRGVGVVGVECPDRANRSRPAVAFSIGRRSQARAPGAARRRKP